MLLPSLAWIHVARSGQVRALLGLVSPWSVVFFPKSPTLCPFSEVLSKRS